MKIFTFLYVTVLLSWCVLAHAQPSLKILKPEPYVAVVDLNMMILPGTAAYLKAAIEQATDENAKAIIVTINTPGGLLNSAQEMIQSIFNSPIPVIIYVTPGGSTATSAGVFITLAGHLAAMAPGTSMGAAHPVSGDGKDFEGDMRAKAEQMAIALVKSIAENRGRNVEWAEKSVKDSSSITDQEALKRNVVDIVALDIEDLLLKAKGKEVKIGNSTITLDDYSKLPRRNIEMGLRDKTINVLANPNVAALLWLGATTGLSLELYNPGAVLPGVVGVICLILALAVSQVIPFTQIGLILLAVGSILIGLEFFVPSGILGLGGVIAIVLGAIYLVDVAQAPGMQVSYWLIGSIAAIASGFLLLVVSSAIKTINRRPITGSEALVGLEGVVAETITNNGKVYVSGDLWQARCSQGILEKGQKVEVVNVIDNIVLEVRPK